MSLFHSGAKREEVEKILNTKGAKIAVLGVLGEGMRPLAELLANEGKRVVGIDRKFDTGNAEELKKRGIEVYGEGRIDLEGFDLVAYSLAIDECSPDISAAQKNKILKVSRAELFGAMMKKYKERIGISGTHGKSTTTAMLSEIFKGANLSFTTVSGAELADGSNLLNYGSDFLIYESCEYKDSFKHFLPSMQLVTNIELDHTDYFKSTESLLESFLTVINGAGRVILSLDDENSRRIIPKIKSKIITCKAHSDADFIYEITDMSKKGTAFKINGEEIFVSVPGEHNVKNAVMAYAAASEYGIEKNVIKEALSQFGGVKRRLEVLYEDNSRVLIYDYAHHPSEIRIAINTVKSLYGAATVIFKPHTYTRTQALWQGFADSLSLADRVLILDIYPAREKEIQGVSSEQLAKDIGKKCEYVKEEKLINLLENDKNEAVVLMGAGGLEKAKGILLTGIARKNGNNS